MPLTKTKEVEELLKILNQKTDQVVDVPDPKSVTAVKKKRRKTRIFRTKKVNLFIKENGFKPGKKYLEAFILYYLFEEWCRKRKNKIIPSTYKIFTAVMNLYFPIRLNATERRFYGLNKNLRLSILNPNKESAIRRYNSEKEKRIQKKQNSSRIPKA